MPKNAINLEEMTQEYGMFLDTNAFEKSRNCEWFDILCEDDPNGLDVMQFFAISEEQAQRLAKEVKCTIVIMDGDYYFCRCAYGFSWSDDWYEYR